MSTMRSTQTCTNGWIDRLMDQRSFGSKKTMFSPNFSKRQNILYWLLHIHQAKPKDSGAYECQINTEPKKSKGYRLHVKVSRAQILGDQDVLVQAGNDINLICRSEELSGTLNHVIWYRNNIQIENLLYRGGISVVTERRRRYSRLLVSKVTKDDGGNYTCAPSNARADSVMVYVISDL